MGIVIAVIILFFIVCMVIGLSNSHNTKSYNRYNKYSVNFSDSESGRIVHKGNGNTVGSALSDGFCKMYYSLSPSSKIDTIDSKLSIMQKTFSRYYSDMNANEISSCEYYIHKTEELRDFKEKDIEAQMERKANEAEAARIEKEKNMDEQRRFVAQQRRLMTDRLRYEVMSRDGFRCQICGATAQDGYKLHVDHIYPVSKGGKTELSNLRTLCERCNMGKSDKIETAVPEPPAVNLSKSDFASIDDLVQALKSKQIEYIDNRSKGGCLWVKSTLANDPFLLSVTVAGVHLIYVDSVRRFNNYGGYYIKPQ